MDRSPGASPLRAAMSTHDMLASEHLLQNGAAE